MTDLGHLLSSVEDGVERAQTGAVASADVVESARRAVRRRRGLRHARESAVGALAVVAVAGVATWGLQQRSTPPADVAPSPTPSATAAPTSPPTAAEPSLPTSVRELGAPVQLATPRDVPIADLLAATGPGWSLTTVFQEHVDTPPDTYDLGDRRTTIALVSPTGERTAFLDAAGGAVGLLDWRTGDPTALASGSVGVGPEATEITGLLDLRTGALTPVTLAWEHHPLGLAVTGESAWFERDMPADLQALDEAERARFSAVAPGSAVAIDPEAWTDLPGADVVHQSGRLRLIAPDGVARDVGDVTLPFRLHPLSPDRTWLALQAPDGGLLGVDLRTGASHPVAGAPTDPACRLTGWADQHAVLAACPAADGTWQLDAVDVADDGGATRLATSDVPVRDAWPLGDGRVGLGRVVLPAPCDVVSDPAVLEGGAVRSLTDGWTPYDHGSSLTFAGGSVWTSLNSCYPGSGRADPQRDVRVDLTTGETTTLGWLEDRRDVTPVIEDDVWRVTTTTILRGR